MATTTAIPVTVRVPARSSFGELRAIKIVWQREMIRFLDDRTRFITSLIQPFLFLFVLGTGLTNLTQSGSGGVDLKTFLYPGILAMSVLFTALFSAASVVWDREFGFLREMLVAPVSRASIVIGKCLGGATTSALQGVLLLAVAGAVGVPYDPVLLLEIFGLQLLLAFTLSAFGLMVAARITQIQSYMAVTQMLVMPLFFISGAIFPVSGLPTWLTVLNRLDPITYAVDPIRHVVFEHLTINPIARKVLDAGVTWGGWQVPPLLETGVVAALGLLMLGIAIMTFSKSE
ncbi:MAG TPA: ABC transporter permease [Pseudonocardiaceae bacterium]